MPEIHTAADKIAAIDLVCDIADTAFPDLNVQRAAAVRQLAEDQSIGDALIRMPGYGHESLNADHAGAIARAAVEAAGGQLVFPDADRGDPRSAFDTAPGRDVYDEIRDVRTGRLAHLGPDRDPDMLVSTAMSWTRSEKGANHRADLVTAAAMLVAAIEAIDHA